MRAHIYTSNFVVYAVARLHIWTQTEKINWTPACVFFFSCAYEKCDYRIVPAEQIAPARKKDGGFIQMSAGRGERGQEISMIPSGGCSPNCFIWLMKFVQVIHRWAHWTLSIYIKFLLTGIQQQKKMSVREMTLYIIVKTQLYYLKILSKTEQTNFCLLLFFF